MPDAGCRMPDAGIMPTGTITREDACTWLDAGAVVLGVGSGIRTGPTPEGRPCWWAKRNALQ